MVSDIVKEAERINKKTNCFITLNLQYKESEKGKLSKFAITSKDNICTKGLRTTAGSRILEKYIPPFNATVIEKIQEQGGEILGKTAMDEFGFGTFSTNCGYDIPKNPWDLTRSTGGSSGGAAAFTACFKFPHIALGQSTGGSISAPAAFCGVVGLTPTYGRVSRYGLIDYANSLDKIGVIGRSVKDCALLFEIISGLDTRDQTTLPEKAQDFSKLDIDLKGLKIGLPEEYFGEGIDEEVKKRVWDGIKILEDLGASYDKVSLPRTKYVIPAYYIIAMTEASTNLAKYSGMRYGMEAPLGKEFNEYFSQVRSKFFGQEAKRRIILGTFCRMAGYRDQYYLKAMKTRTLVIEDFKKAFKQFDVLISPSMPIIAPKFTEIEKLTPLENYSMDILTAGPNLAGIPHLSIPCGFSKGLPVGMHILGDHLQEQKILNVGAAFEKRAPLKFPEV